MSRGKCPTQNVRENCPGGGNCLGVNCPGGNSPGGNNYCPTPTETFERLSCKLRNGDSTILASAYHMGHVSSPSPPPRRLIFPLSLT